MAINRKEVKKEDTWNLEILFASPEEWEKEFEKVQANMDKIVDYKGRLKYQEDLLSCLKKTYNFNQAIETLHSYASHRLNEDLGNSNNNERMAKIRNLWSDFLTIVSFIDPEISRCKKAYLKGLLTNPAFADYRMHISGVIRKKAHLLSEKEEALIASFTDSFDSLKRIFSKAINVDMRFRPVYCNGKKRELTNASYIGFLLHTDRKVRKRVMDNTLKAYSSQRNMFTENLYAHVKSRVDVAKARKYDHVIESFLYSKNIPASVYKKLFIVTNENLHLLHRYCDIRRKAMRLKKLHWYDLYVPIVSGVDRSYTYEEAVSLVGESLQPLGREYVSQLTAGLTTERWVDRYENKGKRSGAYSGGPYHGIPCILLNFNGRLEDVYTLTHEGGHSMHTKFAYTQPYPLYNYNIFLAEIASITNENLLSDYLLKDADKNIRAYILNKKLESVRTTFFRQTMFAEFEAMFYDTVWNGKTITPDFMEKEYLALNKRYYGKNVVVDDPIKHEWSKIPHFFYDFYVYQYATGIASAFYFTKKIQKGGGKERENYFHVLKAGGSDHSIPILLKAGLDVMSPAYLKAIMEDFEKTLNEFEEVIK